MIVYNNSIIKSTKGEFDIVTFEQLKQRLHLEEAKAGHYYYSTSKNPIIKMVKLERHQYIGGSVYWKVYIGNLLIAQVKNKRQITKELIKTLDKDYHIKIS